MRTRSTLVFGWVLAGIPVLLGGAYAAGQTWISQPEVRQFAEDRAREIFRGAELSIGRVGYAPPAGISLDGIQVRETGETGSFSILQIEKLTLSYGLLNLIRRDFNLPSRIVMDGTRVRFRASGGRDSALDSTFSLARSVPSALTVRRGEFHYPWGDTGKELVLRNVRFKAEPDFRGRIRLGLHSELGGVAEGRLAVEGYTDAEFRHYELAVRLKDTGFLPTSGVPLREISGGFHLSDRLIKLEGLTSLFHDWEIRWKGTIQNWREKPKVLVQVTQRKGKTPFGLEVQADFEKEQVSGRAAWPGKSYPFQGKIGLQENRVLFRELKLPRDYQGEGEFDGSNGGYEFRLHRDRRRFKVRSNLSRLEFQTEFELEHASINRMDWVVRGRGRLTPLPKTPRGKSTRFRGVLETDYCIVEFEPLEDFKGTFELSSEGIERMDFGWGGMFRLGGRVLFKGGEPREDLALKVERFPLESIRDFAGRPIPQNLAGELEGKLKLRGEISRPEIHGYFTIKDGALEKLEFDRAIVQFQGFPPYLKLYDSKIHRGHSTFKLLGAIDLRLENIFHGIQVQRPDSLVLWKGVSAYWKEGDSAVLAEKPVSRNVTVGLEVGAGAKPSGGEDSDESHAVVGPKVSF